MPSSEKRFIPTYLTKEQLLEVLDDMKRLVSADDSFEGSMSYEFSWAESNDDPQGFRVRASYRTGNSMGQGGMRMIGEWSR